MPSQDLLLVTNLSKSFGDRILFDEASLVVTSEQKIAVIGRNGAGKTTFIKMLINLEERDNGSVQQLSGCKIGYIAQHTDLPQESNLVDFLVESSGQQAWKCEKELRHFGFNNQQMTFTVSQFSGGWQMRIKLVAMILKEPTLILLDEPTNFLDLNTLVVLEEFLQHYKGATMIISHDRTFLQKVCNTTLEVRGGKLNMFKADLNTYLQFIEEQQGFALSQNEAIDRKQAQLQIFVDKFRAKASKASAAQSKMKQIERLEEEKHSMIRREKVVKLKIPNPINLGRKGEIFAAEKLVIGYPTRAVATTDSLSLNYGSKVAIVGENGQGKSTLIKTIAELIPLLKGEYKWRNSPRVAYYNQQVSLNFTPNETIEEYVNRTIERAIELGERLRMLGSFLFAKKDLDRVVSSLSGGEQSRLYLACMFLSRADAYLLDEPTNHLDMETVEVLRNAIIEFGGTIFVVSHDRSFLEGMVDTVVEVQDGSIKYYAGDYAYYTWRLESQAHDAMADEEEEYLPKGEDDKEKRKKLYLLEKEYKKIERQLEKIEDKKSDKAHELETKYLELLNEIEELKK
jgi:ATP-binding cassette, subfamily F, member 3